MVQPDPLQFTHRPRLLLEESHGLIRAPERPVDLPQKGVGYSPVGERGDPLLAEAFRPPHLDRLLGVTERERNGLPIPSPTMSRRQGNPGTRLQLLISGVFRQGKRLFLMGSGGIQLVQVCRRAPERIEAPSSPLAVP
jgi:hypothetical protein